MVPAGPHSDSSDWLPNPRPCSDDATAALLRDALRREADAVHPPSDGLARILAAARTASPRSGPLQGGPPQGGPPQGGPPQGGPPQGRFADTVPAPAARTGQRSADRAGRISDTVPLARRPLTAADTGPRRLARLLPALSAAAAVMIVCAGLGLARLGWLASPGLDAAIEDAPAAHPPLAEPLPIYFVERQNGRWALVREFSPTTLVDPTDRLSAAVRLAVVGTGTDPDHTSAWRAAGLPVAAADQITVIRGADGPVIRLPAALLGPAPKARGTQAPPARFAVQQLVWTATATAGSTDRVRIEGPTPGTVLFGGYRLDKPVGRDGPDLRAPVWVSSLVDGQRLIPGRAVIQGDAVMTERDTVAWRLIDAAGAQVSAGVAPLRPDSEDALPVAGRGVWEVALQLPAPGRYRFEVAQSWPSTGAATDPAGTAPDWTDSKTLLVS